MDLTICLVLFHPWLKLLILFLLCPLFSADFWGTCKIPKTIQKSFFMRCQRSTHYLKPWDHFKTASFQDGIIRTYLPHPNQDANSGRTTVISSVVRFVIGLSLPRSLASTVNRLDFGSTLPRLVRQGRSSSLCLVSTTVSFISHSQTIHVGLRRPEVICRPPRLMGGLYVSGFLSDQGSR